MTDTPVFVVVGNVNQGKSSVVATLTENEGVRSSWKGHRPCQRRPRFLRRTWSPTTSTMSQASRTWAITWGLRSASTIGLRVPPSVDLQLQHHRGLGRGVGVVGQLGREERLVFDEIEGAETRRLDSEPGAVAEALADAAALLDASMRVRIDDEMIAAIARQSQRGRSLWIATTNLDSGRSVIWSLTRIASSGAPGALELTRDILRASAAIPVAFDPVYIEVEANGGTYDEQFLTNYATINVLDELAREVGRPAWEWEAPAKDESLSGAVHEAAAGATT